MTANSTGDGPVDACYKAVEKIALVKPRLLSYNLKAVRSYLLKEEFQRFWDYLSPAWAGKFLAKWCTKVMRSRIEPMKEIARMLRSHKELIMNWFKARNVIGGVKSFL